MYYTINLMFKSKDFSIFIHLKNWLRYKSLELIHFKSSINILGFKIIYIYCVLIFIFFFGFFEVVIKKIVSTFFMKSEMTKAKTDVANNYRISWHLISKDFNSNTRFWII